MEFHHIVLVGLSGSGKSTIGPRLARRLDLLFVDTDRSVVARAGKSIDEIFSEFGEPTFRAYEREAVREAVAGPRAVISTGAGAPIDATSRAALWEGNAVVWLDAPIDVLTARSGDRIVPDENVDHYLLTTQRPGSLRCLRPDDPSTRRRISASELAPRGPTSLSPRSFDACGRPLCAGPPERLARRCRRSVQMSCVIAHVQRARSNEGRVPSSGASPRSIARYPDTSGVR